MRGNACNVREEKERQRERGGFGGTTTRGTKREEERYRERKTEGEDCCRSGQSQYRGADVLQSGVVSGGNQGPCSRQELSGSATSQDSIQSAEGAAGAEGCLGWHPGQHNLECLGSLFCGISGAGELEGKGTGLPT